MGRKPFTSVIPAKHRAVVLAEVGIQLLASVFRLSAKASSPLNPTLSSRRKPGSICSCFALIGSVSPKTHPCVFPSAFLADGSLLFACPKRSNPEKGHPRGRGRRAPARRLREDATGFADGTSVCQQRTRGHRARAPTGFSFAPSPRPRGTPRSKEADFLSAEADASLRSLRKTSHHSARHTPSFRRRPESSSSLSFVF